MSIHWLIDYGMMCLNVPFLNFSWNFARLHIPKGNNLIKKNSRKAIKKVLLLFFSQNTNPRLLLIWDFCAWSICRCKSLSDQFKFMYCGTHGLLNLRNFFKICSRTAIFFRSAFVYCQKAFSAGDTYLKTIQKYKFGWKEVAFFFVFTSWGKLEFEIDHIIAKTAF